MSGGFFLVLEGPEGAGKTTLAAALAERFRAAGQEPLRVREPGGTPAGEALREVLLHPAGTLRAEQELLFMTAARGVHVMQVIRPALERGAVVISDRFDLSTLAYQGAGRGLPVEQVAWVNRCATDGLAPDLTLILDLPPGIGLQRQVSAGKSRDRLDRESLEFHERVAARYRVEQGPGIVHLDATRSPAALAEEAWNAVLAARPTFAPAGAR
jgi:dTMP kinase